MKLRIMQQGGGLIYTPFIPGAQSTTATTSKSSSSSDDPKLDPLDKELISLMKDQNLLSSDIQQIYNRLIRFQKQTQRLSGLEGTDAYRSAMPGMLQILGMVNEAKSNKEDAKEVEERMISENAGSDIALDNYGRMYVLSDGKLDTVAISKFDPEKHQALSNSQMLSYRENELPFDKSILSGLRNMVGMSSISKEIERMIKAIGTKEESQYITANANVKKVLSAIADGPDGIYKLSAKERSEGLQPAWKAIYDNLPKNMQNVIRANAAVAGTDYRDIIQDMVLRQTDTKFDVNYDSTISKAAGYNTDPNKTDTKSTTQVKDTYPERLATGEGFDPEQWIDIMPNNTGVRLHAYAQNVGPVVKGENRMNSASLSVILQQADGIGTITDAQSITFGDQLLNENEAKMLMVDTNVNMQRVWLPIKFTTDGRYTPDFEAQQKLERAQQYIRDNNGQISDIYIEEWLRENLPSAKWDRENKQIVFDKTSMKPFLVLHGIGTSRRLDFETNSPYLHNLTRDEASRYKDLYELSINEDSRNGSIKSAKGKDISTGSKNKFYSGNIYIPISGSTIAAGIHNSQYFDRDVYTDITQKARINEQRQQMTTNF